MDIRDVLHDIVDAEFVGAGFLAVAGLLASVWFTAFRPPVALGVIYLVTVLAISLQRLRGGTLEIHHVAVITAVSFLMVIPYATLRGTSVPRVVVFSGVVFMLLLGVVKRSRRVFLGGAIVATLPVLTWIDYQVRFVGQPYSDPRMTPGPFELLLFWILVVGFAIAMGFPLYTLGRWSAAPEYLNE